MQNENDNNADNSSLKAALRRLHGSACLKNACRCLDYDRIMMIMMTTTITSNSVSVLHTALLLLLVSNSK